VTIAAGLRLLRERYTLVDEAIDTGGNSESWLGVGEDDRRFLVRLWPYTGENPPDLLRALWDAELRTLYRVASAPGADQTILVIRDAGLDRTAKCFVMVLEAEHSGGYDPLSDALAKRNLYPWLRTTDLSIRRDLWLALGGLADGIALLHEQNILHRNIEARRVYFNSDTGVRSLRLGGFEWSVRLGVPATGSPPAIWSSPPEFFTEKSFGYRPETDWYAFGMLAARCFRPIESLERFQGLDRHQRVLAEVDKAPQSDLSNFEKDMLFRLIADDPNERLNDAKLVRNQIDEIVIGLANDFQSTDNAYPLVVAISPGGGPELLERMVDLGFVINPDNPDDTFNPRDPIHVGRYTQFIQSDLNAAEPCPRVSSVRNKNFYLLEGRNLILMLTQFKYTDRTTNQTERTWSVGYCSGIAELRGKESSIELMNQPISVRSIADVLKRFPLKHVKTWQRFLPRIDPSSQMRADLSRFYNYIRCTNQIELLMRDAEIFAYELVGEPIIAPAKIQITIREIERARPVLKMFRIDGGLTDFLQREATSGKPNCRQVLLIEQETLLLEGKEWNAHSWSIEKVDSKLQHVILSRVIDSNVAREPPRAGYARAWGMFGQVPLVQRRKRAIDRLEKHSFLLRSLSAPGQVYMDTGFSPLPVPVPIEKVDAAKQAALEDILRVRPIFTLQGPPGTGKTTLVAHLLRQIFEEDPVAQVLITAQAHGAVDVLRAKVRDEAFLTVPEEKLPLSVRIGTERNEVGEEADGSVRQVGLEILRSARERLAKLSARGELQQSWLDAIEEMLRNWDRKSLAGIDDFFQTVKRGASITYCTTSAGDLEALADSIQSFDWAIVEEAGKAYAFDLALPLQMGHRWLLIGDHNQLPPYKFEEHEDAISSLEEVTKALQSLPGFNSSLIDLDWIRAWSELDQEDREDFTRYVQRWLNAFKQFFQLCSKSSGSEKLTTGTSLGAAAGKLTEQHRMHPAIGTLISTVFYDDTLINRTEVDGKPIGRVLHPFVKPDGIEGKAILWIDTDWSARDPQFRESGRGDGETKYNNAMEADALVSFIQGLEFDPSRLEECESVIYEIVALAPYTQQVVLLNSLFDPTKLPPGLTLMKGAAKRGRAGGGVQFAHTIDSFQGNQADVVCVSLVRNNTLPATEGLGFLADKARLNVLMSRAKRLLVLFGSWDFFEFQMRSVTEPTDALWHWKKTMLLFEEEVRAKRALRMEAAYSTVGTNVITASN
jgi:serine/threonine protein kinase/DNA polymerase III delta prime subunit